VYDITYLSPTSLDMDIPSLIARIKDTDYTIHSQMYPIKEAEKLVDNTDFTSQHIIVLGFGLGYVSASLRAKYPKKRLILIEPDINLFYHALKYCDLTYIDFDLIYVGVNDTGIKKLIADLSPSSGGQKPAQHDIYTLKSEERIFSSLFLRIKSLFQQKSIYNLSTDWRYKKFTTQQCRILFIDSAYVLSKECLNAIKNTGNLVHYIHIDIDSVDYEQFVKNLMSEIISFRPDFVLTINHLGFDKDGRLTELFDEIELPYASWFVDSPKVILSTADGNVSDFCHLFVWDDDYIPQLNGLGYKNCEYMPLATDLDIFFPRESSYQYNVSFVGSSMIYAIHKNMQSWVHRDDLLSAFQVASAHFLSQKNRHVEHVLELPILKDVAFDNASQKDDFLAAVLWRATHIYRQTGISKLSRYMPTISGDPNWENILPIEFSIIKERWYYDTLADFYSQSRINFNMTSLQMTNAINQRVFDVSACQKFLLTDYRKQIDELMGGKENVIYFHDVGEIPELIEYYLAHPTVREDVSHRAYEHVKKHHTYQHRIRAIIQTMRKCYEKNI
jgi:spore maturation protein CgeB